MITRRVPFLLAALLTLVSCASAPAQDATIRVATYNIKFLDTGINDTSSKDMRDRKDRLLAVIEALGADVIGLQEIDDAAALDAVFPRSEWIQIIDDDSGDDQDVAMVVRKSTLSVVDSTADRIDADDMHFLFEDAPSEFFPNKRDVLAIELMVNDTGETFTLMVVHTKARHGGRKTTEPRRSGASVMLVQRLESEFQDRQVIVVGDFNDTPDDRSLNILETGDPDAPASMENEQGEFLVNLTETLLVDEHVSWGKKTNDIDRSTDRIDTTTPGSRAFNFEHRDSDDLNIWDALLDQILISHNLLDNYHHGSVGVLDLGDAARGNNKSRASDHLPVYADFVFAAPGRVDTPALTIHACLPDPQGEDGGNETVTLRNNSTATIDLDGHTLTDRAGHVLALSGTIDAGATRVIAIPAGKLPLNNTGEDLALTDGSGVLLHEVSYTRARVSPGIEIAF
ncbi:MAG: endonuclease/exonuclease/phosphatase family protein [Phycisphaerales bacterium JB040]